jgi:hypothetical protein
VVAGSCCSPPSFLPRRLFSPKKLLTEDAIPRCAPIALLRLSSVPPDRSRPMISIASLCAGSRASGSFNKFCIDGRSRSRTLVEGRSVASRARSASQYTFALSRRRSISSPEGVMLVSLNILVKRCTSCQRKQKANG